MFAIDLFPLYTPVYLGVSLFFINEILLLIKKKGTVLDSLTIRHKNPTILYFYFTSLS